MEHVDIPDGERHEPKGAGSASANQVLRSTGSGNTTFSFLTKASFPNVSAETYGLIVNGASSALVQNPVGLDTPLQIEFGPAQIVPEATLSSTGTLTISEAGSYSITVFLRFGRTTSVGNAIVLSRILLNGSQILNTNVINIPDENSTTPFSATFFFDLEVGDEITFEIARDSNGIDNGGLVRTPLAVLPWNIPSSASLAVYKHRGLV